jgi:hypothetical protein
MIWRVTGYHQNVGNVSVAGGSAIMNVNHLREGQMFNSIESATILSVITFLTAGMLTELGDEQYPGLTEDWSAVLLDRKARRVFMKFHRSLLEYADIVENRNAELEGRKYTLNDFNPRYCKCSVSS